MNSIISFDNINGMGTTVFFSLFFADSCHLNVNKCLNCHWNVEFIISQAEVMERRRRGEQRKESIQNSHFDEIKSRSTRVYQLVPLYLLHTFRCLFDFFKLFASLSDVCCCCCSILCPLGENFHWFLYDASHQNVRQ